MEGISEESDITYRATKGYLPLHDGEIELVGGDVITNVKDLCNGWTLGRNASRDSVGIFPTDFIVPQVDLIPPPEENANLSRRSSRKSLERQSSLIEELQKIHKDLTDANNQQKLNRDNNLDKKKSPEGGHHMYEKIARRPQKPVPPTRKGPDLLDATASEEPSEEFMTGSLPSPGRKGHLSQKPRMFVRPNPSKNIFVNPNTGPETQAKQIEGRESPTCQVSGSNTPPQVHRVNGTPTRIPRHGTPPLQSQQNATVHPDPRMDHYQAGPSQTPPIQGPLEAASPTDANRISTSMESTERDNIVNETANSSPRVPPGNKQQKFSEMKRAYYQDYRTLECPSLSDSPPHGLKFKPILKGKNGTHSRANEIYYREEPDQQRGLRILISFLAAVFIGCILFLWLHFALSYTLMITTFVCVSATVLLILFFATSRLCRCVGGLVLPSVCTTRGRLAFLIIITGFLLDGPVTNIYVNIEEVSRSMSCSAEQNYNQSMLLLKPFDTMMQNLNHTVSRLQMAAMDVSIGMAPLRDGLHKLEFGIYEGHSELLGTYVTCQSMVARAYNDCATGIDEAQNQCVAMVNTLGDVYHIARGVLDQLNPELWAPKHVSLQKRQAFVAEGTLSSIPEEKRDVCEPLNSGQVCASLNSSDNLCQPAGWAGDAIHEAVNMTQSAMKQLQGNLRFQVHPESYYKARFNATRTVYLVQKKVQSEFDLRTAYFEFVISILKKILPGAILILVYVAYDHVRHYVSKDTYDNTYVTPQFKSLDQKRSEVAGESLLPLKKYERNRLIDMTLSELSPPEEGLYRIGMLVFFLHILITFCCYFFDYILYWILAMIRRHGDPPIDFSGKENLEYVVKGTGVIAQLLDVFLKGFHPALLFGYTLDTHACLPRPNPPSISILLILFLFYFALLLTILLKAYILRVRNRITAYFYPDREKARIVHLYNVVLNHRFRMPKLLQQRAKINFREKSMREQISVCHKMAAKIAPCRVFVYKRTQCLVCGNVEDQTFRDCQTDRCQGAYCAECYEDLGHICPLCHQASEYSDDEDYEDLEDDLQPYTRSSKIYV